MEGMGFIVILKLVGEPIQVLENGVTIMLVETGTLLPFVMVTPLILPSPLAAKPMPGLELDH